MKRPFPRILAFFLLASLLAACEPQATPPPASEETTTEPPPQATVLPSVNWAWTPLQAETPTALVSMSAAYDSDRRVTVLFGGRDGNQPLSETWEFNGNSWRQVATAHTPPARFWHGMAYDTTRQVVILFGGDASITSTSLLNDTWEYDGRDWEQIVTTHSPEPRGRGALLVYDSCRQATVLFGGETAGGVEASTWEYDGSDWQQIRLPLTPPGRGLAAMTFDPSRCRAILFGGGSGPNGLNDTWEYDGAAWTRIETPASPPARWAHAMVYSPAAGSVILFGGYLPGSATAANDTWAYDGETWTRSNPEDPPPAQEQGILAVGSGETNVFLLGSGGMWALRPTAAIGITTTAPTAALQPAAQQAAFENVMPGSFFILQSNARYTVRAVPLPGADGYAWRLLRGETILWDSYAESGRLTGTTIYLMRTSIPIAQILPGEALEFQVRASIGGQWTRPAAVTIHIFNTHDEYIAWSVAQASATATPPPAATPTPHCATGWTRLSIDDYAVVTEGDPNRVRSGPATSAEIVLQIYPGTIVRILEGPVCADGLVFWRIENSLIPGGFGWTAEGDMRNYWLEPYQP